MHNTRDGSRREAAIKTGTTNELKDYSTYGILPMPKSKKQPALAVGVWYGNSDSSSPNLGLLRYSMDNAGQTWVAFVTRVHEQQASPRVQATEGCRQRRVKIYIAGTQPGASHQVDTSAPRVTTTTPNTSGSTNAGTTSTGGGGSGMAPPAGGSSGMGTGGGGSSGMGGGPAPAPTCRPGSTTKPPGCTVLAPGLIRLRRTASTKVLRACRSTLTRSTGTPSRRSDWRPGPPD